MEGGRQGEREVGRKGCRERGREGGKANTMYMYLVW